MLIATFGPTTAWVGKKITRDGDALILEDHGPISAQDIMEYDRQGHLVWVNDGTRAWIGAKAKGSQPSHAAAAATATAPSKTTEAPGSTTGAGSRSPPRKPTYLKRALLLAIALLVVTNVALLLLIAGVFRGPSKAVDSVAQTAAPQSQASVASGGPTTAPAASWPAQLAGTWSTTESGAQTTKLSFAETGGQASITGTVADGRTYSYVFVGDTMTANWLDRTPAVFRRQTPSSEPYLGAYVWTTSSGTTTAVVSFSDKTLALNLSGAPVTVSSALTFTIAEDGATLSQYDSGTKMTTVYARQ